MSHISTDKLIGWFNKKLSDKDLEDLCILWVKDSIKHVPKQSIIDPASRISVYSSCLWAKARGEEQYNPVIDELTMTRGVYLKILKWIKGEEGGNLKVIEIDKILAFYRKCTFRDMINLELKPLNNFKIKRLAKNINVNYLTLRSQILGRGNTDYSKPAYTLSLNNALLIAENLKIKVL